MTILIAQLSVREMSSSGKEHRNACLLRSCNNFLIPHASARLNNGGNACGGENLKAIGKWEECIRCANATCNAITCAIYC
jgi:hypothetical protein